VFDLSSRKKGYIKQQLFVWDSILSGFLNIQTFRIGELVDWLPTAVGDGQVSAIYPFVHFRDVVS